MKALQKALAAWWAKYVITPDPDPVYSRLDRMDGLVAKKILDTRASSAWPICPDCITGARRSTNDDIDLNNIDLTNDKEDPHGKAQD